LSVNSLCDSSSPGNALESCSIALIVFVAGDGCIPSKEALTVSTSPLVAEYIAFFRLACVPFQ
jgi:hypothetical protein